MSEAERAGEFLDLCAGGDAEAVRCLLAERAGLALVHRDGWTGLHYAAKHGDVEIVRLLLEHGADPNAREDGDNTYPLHWAAAAGQVEIARALLDAGGDVHGVGDLHELDVIGWATYFGSSDDVPALLIERGARHHIISAVALGDLDVIRQLVEENPSALDRRMSRFEQRKTAVELAMSRKRDDIVELLIELGAEPAFAEGMGALTGSVHKIVPMIKVADVDATLEWYVSIGFEELGRYEDDGAANWGMVAFGKAEVMVVPQGQAGEQSASLWFYTDKVDELYELFRRRPELEFVEGIHDTFYGAREFGIRDLNGYSVYFIQPVTR